MTGTDGGEPSPVGAAIADHIAAQNLVGGILAALIARGRTGRGQLVETSLVGGQIGPRRSEFTSFLSSGRVPGRPTTAIRSYPASTASTRRPTAGSPSSG